MKTQLEKWLEEQRANSTMKVNPGSLNGIEPWEYKDNNGQWEYSRSDGKFFRLAGFQVQTGSREVSQWNQPMLEETTGPGVLVLVTDGHHCLVTAREEPGNPPDKNYILLGPTLQASESNLTASHGGKLPPRSELYVNEWIEWGIMPADGGRYHNKTNRVGILYKKREVNAYKGCNLKNEFWASFSDLYAAIKTGDVSSHLAECLALALFRV